MAEFVNEPNASIWHLVAKARTTGNSAEEMLELISQYIYCVGNEVVLPELPKNHAEVELMYTAYRQTIEFFEDFHY